MGAGSALDQGFLKDGGFLKLARDVEGSHLCRL